MGIFAYKALDRRQLVVTGTIAAETPRQARDELRSQGLWVREIADAGASREWLTGLFRWRSVSRSGLASVIRDTATLLAVGIPLLESLDTVANQHRGALKRSLLVLRDRVAAGSGLADAMREQPEVFNFLCVQMVEVGENTGNLDSVMLQLAEFQENALQLKDRVTTALLYPTFILLVSIGVSIFLMTAVVPMLLTNLLDAGKVLPWPTRVLKGLSDFLVSHGWWIGIGVGLVALGMTIGLRTPGGKLLWYRLLHRMPLLGTMAKLQTISRVAMLTSVLLRSGIEFLKAIEVAARSTSDLVVRGALERAACTVQAGQEIGPALAASGVFPPVVVQVFSVGQQTGQMEEMLERLGKDYDRQVTTFSARLTAAIEPVLIILLGLIVGFILFATVLPILEAGNVL